MHVSCSDRANAAALVLVVDDNPVNQQVAVGLLRKLGISSAVAANGLAAIDMLRAQRFALVLMDLQMPGLDGVAATRRIRSGEAGVLDPRVPVLALTANAFPDYRRQCLEAGFDDFLTKPVDVELLGTTLRRWLPAAITAAPGRAAAAVSARESPPSKALPPDRIVFDRSGLLERSMEDAGLAREILAAFLAEASALYASLVRELRGGNAAQLRAAAHSIKGAAANAGALRVAGLAAMIESVARAGDVSGAAPLAEELGVEIDVFRRRAPQELETGADAGSEGLREAVR